MGLFKLENTIQNYSWGSINFISSFLGINNVKKEPQAELWMGAHPKAPSIVIDPNDGQKTPLNSLIEEHPELMLGKDNAQKFSNKLPFLLKVLSADKPLSIQAHPRKRKAELGYSKEELAGVAIDATDRNYRDKNHKPETLVALDTFEALCGFRPISEIISYTKFLVPDKWKQVLGKLVDNPSKLELSAFCYIQLTKKHFHNQFWLDRYRQTIENIVDRSLPSSPEYKTFIWIQRLMDYYPGDTGCLSPILLNTITLNKGEAINLKPGIIHAYLRGSGVEIMGNSDNVLRGGLTKKHIDISELMSVVSFEYGKTEIFNRNNLEPNTFFTYPYNTSDYKISYAEITTSINNNKDISSPEILLCSEGNLDIECKCGQKLNLKKGESVFISANNDSYVIKGQGNIYKASVPVENDNMQMDQNKA